MSSTNFSLSLMGMMNLFRDSTTNGSLSDIL